MKHTPAPWRIDATALEYTGQIVVLHDVQDDNPVHICAVTTSTKRNKVKVTPEEEANGLLIAAAPDLLRALQEIITAADGGGWSALDPSFKRQRDAVARATGEAK